MAEPTRPRFSIWTFKAYPIGVGVVAAFVIGLRADEPVELFAGQHFGSPCCCSSSLSPASSEGALSRVATQSERGNDGDPMQPCPLCGGKPFHRTTCPGHGLTVFGALLVATLVTVVSVRSGRHVDVVATVVLFAGLIGLNVWVQVGRVRERRRDRDR